MRRGRGISERYAMHAIVWQLRTIRRHARVRSSARRYVDRGASVRLTKVWGDIQTNGTSMPYKSLGTLHALRCYKRLRSSEARVFRCGRSFNAASGWLPGGGCWAAGMQAAAKASARVQGRPRLIPFVTRFAAAGRPASICPTARRAARRRATPQPSRTRRRYTLAATPSPLHPRRRSVATRCQAAAGRR